MNHVYHFIAGLPRSGESLLAGLLLQNPEITAGMTSPVSNLCSVLMKGMSTSVEDGVFFDDTRRAAVIHGVFDGFYHDARRVVMDTNRLWPQHLTTLTTLFPGGRVVCCVRDVAWIMDSFEQIYQNNKFRSFGFDLPKNVYERCALNAAQEGPLGRAIHALREGIYGPFSDRLILVRYESLVSNPGYALDRIYRHIGEETYLDHDFDNVEFTGGDAYDEAQGLPGMHKVRPAVEAAQRQTILPPELFKQYGQYNFWERPDEMPSHIEVV